MELLSFIEQHQSETAERQSAECTAVTVYQNLFANFVCVRNRKKFKWLYMYSECSSRLQFPSIFTNIFQLK